MKKNIVKYQIITPLFFFFIISYISIYSALKTSSSFNIIYKQVIWYIISFIIIYVTKKFECKKIIYYAPFLYFIGIILLFLLLIFGKEINGSKCWFVIPKIGSFQPSEFMKLILIITNVRVFEYFEKKYNTFSFKTDLKIFITIMFLTLIPSILTFLEPDTGMVIIYFLISIIMLFIFGLRKSIFIFLVLSISIALSCFLYFYFNYQDNFINIFGTSFFYRIDRLLNWSNKSGMQITHAIAAIKASGIFGFGIGNTPIYIPEAHTDFIFSVYANNTGFLGTIFLIGLIVIFDEGLFKLANNSNDKSFKYIVAGFSSMIIYQQFQNIGMNIGILPITGITLPFISYGGSSLISYMLAVALILNYNSRCKKQKSAFQYETYNNSFYG